MQYIRIRMSDSIKRDIQKESVVEVLILIDECCDSQTEDRPLETALD